MTGNITMGANDISGPEAITATTFNGDLNGTINTATTAITQTAGNNSTKITITAYADAASTDDQTAAEVTSSTTGNIVATDVDSAITELEAEKLALTGGTMTGDLTVAGLTVSGEVALNKSISTDNTSQSVTIHAIAGSFRFQNGTDTKTVLNSFVNEESIIICTISGTNVIPRTITSCVAGVGQFIVTINGDTFTDTFDINFLVIN